MRHRVSKIRLGRKPHQSRMILRNLATSVLLYENVRTTKKRAELVQPIVDNIITIAKKNTPMAAIRRINTIVMDKNACRKALEVYAKRYAGRTSGFTRVKPAGMRGGDGAKLVDLSFVEGADVAVTASEKKQTKQKKQKKSSVSSASSDSSVSSK